MGRLPSSRVVPCLGVPVLEEEAVETRTGEHAVVLAVMALVEEKHRGTGVVGTATSTHDRSILAYGGNSTEMGGSQAWSAALRGERGSSSRPSSPTMCSRDSWVSCGTQRGVV